MKTQLNTGNRSARYFGSKEEAEEALASYLQGQENGVKGSVWLVRTYPAIWTARITSHDEDGYDMYIGNLQPV